VNTLEDRLRDAYQAAAQTVRPETVLAGGVRGLRDTERGRRAPRPRGRRLIPLAAAAAVTAVAVGATVLAQHATPGPSRARAGGATVSTPGYFVALDPHARPPYLFAVSAVDGAKSSVFSLPSSAGRLAAVATGDGRMFLAATVRPGACGTDLYRFGLTAHGRPAAVTEFATVPGEILATSALAVTANGQTVAYAAGACAPSQSEYLAVVNTVTGQSKRWTFPGHGGPSAVVSLSADGSTVLCGNLLVRTDARDGPIEARGSVVHTARYAEDLELAPDGKTVYFTTLPPTHPGEAEPWTVRALNLATEQIRLVVSFPSLSAGEPVSVDPTGRYLLGEYWPRWLSHAPLLIRIDVATREATQLTSTWGVWTPIVW
jgi:hypothetical protein